MTTCSSPDIINLFFVIFIFIEELTLRIIPNDIQVIQAEDPPLLIKGRF